MVKARHPVFGTEMYAHTQRAHFSPEWHGDRLLAIREVSERPLGPDKIHAIDMNFQIYWVDLKDPAKGFIVVNNHWYDAGRNNYHYIVTADGKHVRRMTKAELRHNHKWTAGEVHRWRRGPHKNSARPQTYAATIRYAKAHGVVVCAELKSRAFGRSDVGKRLVAQAKRYDHPDWFMSLFWMKGSRKKCAAVISSGGQFAVIFGSKQWRRAAYRVAVKTWKYKPTRVW